MTIKTIYDDLLDYQSIRDALDSDDDLCKKINKYIQKQDKYLLDKYRNKQAWVSEIYWYLVISSKVSDTEPIIKRELGTILSNVLLDTGGASPGIYLLYDWQKEPRIYSTYYAICLANSTDYQFPKEWLSSTYHWLLNHQITEGENEGCFQELDAPSVIDIRNVYWAVSILFEIEKILSIENLAWKEKVKKWIKNQFLSNQEFWSATKLFYGLLTILDVDPHDLDDCVHDAIMHFIEDLSIADGYTEYPSSAKDRYRDDETIEQPYIHSTLHVLGVSIIANIPIDQVSIKKLVDQYWSKIDDSGVGTRVVIQQYELKPVYSDIELLTLLILRCRLI